MLSTLIENSRVTPGLEAVMSTRTTETTVTFSRSFTLSALEGTQPGRHL